MIVDDEEPAREELLYMLGQIPQVKVIGETAIGMDAIKKAKELKPEFVFLDIQLPDLSGLQVAELIREMDLNVEIVFITAYDHFAVEAFKLRAFHYILKPYDFEDLQQVFAMYGKEMNPKAKFSAVSSTSKLAVEIEDDIKYLSPHEIVYIVKEGRGVVIHTAIEKYEAQYTLQKLEEKLAPYSFIRTHKSYLVNLGHVKEMRAWFNGSYNVYMDDPGHSTVPVSRNYVKELRHRLEL
ncbi:LytTR family DNA-binding domain-containing protein [Fodinisporobacter ferrooxydans]|uniref:LytTR family DNA-binding domain-containing protein n=1 Tax=Fodinisporobacter ferrooxydans TaxID=2901836 RepID=A0ABY4CFD6_9BACL|nr:LytTR family DNA-binding domain-containing protein [Alicyclobacillaceae bacterium MYW30-H2]